MTLIRQGEYVSHWEHDDGGNVTLIMGEVIGTEDDMARVRGHAMKPAGLKGLQIEIAAKFGGRINVSLEDLLEACTHTQYDGLLRMDNSLNIVRRETWEFVDLYMTHNIPEMLADATEHPQMVASKLRRIQTGNAQFNETIYALAQALSEDTN